MNDWASQDIARSNFNAIHVSSKPVHTSIENLNPLPGERKLYGMESASNDNSTGTDYGVIKMVILPHGGKVLLLDGLSSVGTAGVGEFFTNPAKMKLAYERIAATAPGKPFPPQWEVLLKISMRDALPVESSVVAVRPAPAAR